MPRSLRQLPVFVNDPVPNSGISGVLVFYSPLPMIDNRYYEHLFGVEYVRSTSYSRRSAYSSRESIQFWKLATNHSTPLDLDNTVHTNTINVSCQHLGALGISFLQHFSKLRLARLTIKWVLNQKAYWSTISHQE